MLTGLKDNFRGVLGKVINAYLPEAMFFCGIASVCWGIHMYSVPIAWIFGGAVAAAIGYHSYKG